MAETKLLHADLTGHILKVYFEVFNELGHGFLESVYENAMAVALRQDGLNVATQQEIAVWFRDVRVGDFRADMIVDGKVILKLKAARALEPIHQAQLLNYLRATRIEVGLLLNFGERPEFKRLAFANDRKFSHTASAEPRRT